MINAVYCIIANILLALWARLKNLNHPSGHQLCIRVSQFFRNARHLGMMFSYQFCVVKYFYHFLLDQYSRQIHNLRSVLNIISRGWAFLRFSKIFDSHFNVFSCPQNSIIKFCSLFWVKSNSYHICKTINFFFFLLVTT